MLSRLSANHQVRREQARRDRRDVRDLRESREVPRLDTTELREAAENLALAIRAATRRNRREFNEGLAPRHDYYRAVCWILKNAHAIEAQEQDRQSFRKLIEAQRTPK